MDTHVRGSISPRTFSPDLNITNISSPLNCTEDPGILTEDVPIVVTCAIAIVFNLLIFITNINRRRTKKKLDDVNIQFTMLALTDFFASLLMLIHYSVRMSYWKKSDLERMLNDRFNSDNASNAILVADGKYETYIGLDFLLIKKETETCGKLTARYYTLRWFAEASTRLVLVYINISRTIAIYKSYPKERSEKSAILNLSLVAFGCPTLFMIGWVVAALLKVNAFLLASIVYMMTFAMPFFILLVAAIMLIHKIRSVAKGLKEIPTARAQKEGPKGARKADRRRTQMIIIVIVVTVTYLLTHLPGLVHLMGKKLWKSNPEVDSILSRMTAVMIAVNSLVNFPLFLCLSEQFLKEFRLLFGCSQEKRQTRSSVDNPSNI